MKLRDFWAVLGVLLLAGLVLGIAVGSWGKPRGKKKIAGGAEGGAYDALVVALAKSLEDTQEGRIRMETLQTDGSGENHQLLKEGKVDFGIVQSSAPEEESIRLVAPLYTGVLHLLVRKEEYGTASGIKRLEGKRVVMGLQGSGTRKISEYLFEHFGIDVESSEMSPREGVEKLLSKEVDAVCFLAALHAPIFDEIMATGKVTLLSLGDEEQLEGLCSSAPHLKVMKIFAASYRGGSAGVLPGETVNSLGVESLLVCRNDVSSNVVRVVTETLFASRGSLMKIVPEVANIREPGLEHWSPYAVHRGAQSYYRRADPGFLVRYAEVMALLFSLGLSGMAGIGALRKWSERSKKNRIDFFYQALSDSMDRLVTQEMTPEELVTEEQDLWRLRKVAFNALVEEKIEADDSFRIFQDQLRYCLEEVRR